MHRSREKILVTGASGFIGSHLCSRLLRSGHEVVGISRRSNVNANTCTNWVQADLIAAEAVASVLQRVGPDIIFHLASHVSGSRELANVEPTFNANLVSTVNLLTAATQTRCHRIILVGSMEEPDNAGEAVIPASPYAAAKFAASAYGRMFHALYDTPVTIARLFMVYGPGQLDLKKLIPFVVLSLLKKKIPQLSSGKRLVDWIYVSDVVDALVSMTHASEIEGKTVDIGSGSLTSVKSIVLKLSKMVDPSVTLGFGDLDERPMEQVRVANIDKTAEMIAWRSQTSLDQGLKETIRWYRNEYGHQLN